MASFNRRNFLAALPVIPLTRAVPFSENQPQHSNRKQSLKISLNAYSFNDMLMKKKITTHELIDFCSTTGFDAIDMTGYYFSTYPEVPTDKEIFEFKRHAHARGLSISGTGVRNEFSYAEDALLNKEIELVLKWIEVAAKLGAPVLRIFTAKKYYTGEERKVIFDRLVKSISRCLEKASAYGIILGIQNHNDFLRTYEETKELIDAINSPWLGLVLDTGSFISNDPYRDIEKSIPMAVNWQFKEKLPIQGVQTVMDIPKLCQLIKNSEYKGFVPIETLGLNEPLREVPIFFEKVKKQLLD
jgi:sugar phosphate isomerase/epimerase